MSHDVSPNGTAWELTLQNILAHLEASQSSSGHWEGRLSSSALSTATAIGALQQLVCSDTVASSTKATMQRGIDRGRIWLVNNQNEDGGFGDTDRSLSNVSTTLLCWAALTATGPQECPAQKRAADWIQRHVGSDNPANIAAAIRARYGKDQTFSVPILMFLASMGCLGEKERAWQHVPQLPFELASLPQHWFSLFRFPVVSYALPALIAIGLVRHRRCPSRNPIASALRNRVVNRVLNVLQRIQPESGGYLEAIPLTSFVVVSMVGAGEANHPVVQRGAQFLLDGIREDGSWPIDTHLATWVTSLSVNGLKHLSDWSTLKHRFRGPEVRVWIEQQQYKCRHPYTDAAPGGWSWTPLTGGVPDADDTPGALLALDALQGTEPDPKTAVAAQQGVRWLMGLQNRDGGIPTFCRGWGTLPFDRSNPDITAHTLRAWLQWSARLDSKTQRQLQRCIVNATRFLTRQQRENGSWVPLWFGNQYAKEEENPTYGTSRVLLAFLELASRDASRDIVQRISQAKSWLLQAQNADGGWGGDRGVVSSIEETALAIEALIAYLQEGPSDLRNTSEMEVVSKAIARGLDHLVDCTREGTVFPASPIGFYFAKLWYYEQHYPLVYALTALSRAQRFGFEKLATLGHHFTSNTSSTHASTVP